MIDNDAALPACPQLDAWPAWLVGEMRSNHAGESGAVMIYRGILMVSRDETVRAFAERHLKTEAEHLTMIESLCAGRKSVFTGVWRILGWMTGALPALVGSQWVFATIDAVESFVDHHYAAQINRLDERGPLAGVRAILEACREDEVAHRDEARALTNAEHGYLLRLWCKAVDIGSKIAVAVAKRI